MHNPYLLLKESMILKVCHFQIFNPILKWHVLRIILKFVPQTLSRTSFSTRHNFYENKYVLSQRFLSFHPHHFIGQCIWLRLLWMQIKCWYLFDSFRISHVDVWQNKEYTYTKSVKHTGTSFFCLLETVHNRTFWRTLIYSSNQKCNLCHRWSTERQSKKDHQGQVC